MTDRLDNDFAELRKRYEHADLERREDGSALVTIRNFPLKGGWSAKETTILFVVPVGYPIARPDTFWTDEGLRLENGGMPSNTAINTNYGGSHPRLWFSFHPGSWNPNLDNLIMYMNLIKRRLSEAR